MRAPRLALLVVIAAAAAPRARAAEDDSNAAAPASAQPAPATETAPGEPGPPPGIMRPPKTFPKLRQASLLHKNQLGIAVLPGIGFRGIFPYQEMVNCGQQGKRVCTGLLPLFLDVQPSFGFAEHWDVLTDLRFGIGTDFTTSHEFAVAPG